MGVVHYRTLAALSIELLAGSTKTKHLIVLRNGEFRHVLRPVKVFQSVSFDASLLIPRDCCLSFKFC